MRKKMCIAVLAISLLLSACARIPGIDSLDRLVQSSDAEEQENREALKREDEDDKTDNLKKDSQLPVINGGEDSGEDGEGNDSKEDSGNSLEKDGRSEADSESGETDSYVMGTIMDDGWESEYWNLRYTAPEGVYMLSEEGLNTVMGLSKEVLAESYSEQQQKYMELTSLYEMMSMTVTGETNVEVKVEKLLIKGMSTEDYKKAALLQLRLVKNPVYEILDDSGTAEIGGETFAMVNAIVTIGDNRYTQDYYFRVKGERALIIAITYTDDTVSTAEEILNGFDVY